MKKHYYPIGSNNDRTMGTKKMWDDIYKNVSFNDYILTLGYDETAEYLQNIADTLPRDIRILDLGCGGGRHLHLLSKMGFNNLTGLDLSSYGLKIAKENIPEINAIHGDITRLPFNDNEFDLILMVGIFYEIDDVNLHYKSFSEIKRVLKREGLFIFVNNSPYNVGERFYEFTENLRRKKKDEELAFFVWRVNSEDIDRLTKSNNLKINSVCRCNYGKNLFRFFYGIFVKKELNSHRKENINSINTYSLNEQYLSNKESEMFNFAGKILLKMRFLFNNIFYNSEIYLINNNGKNN